LRSRKYQQRPEDTVAIPQWEKMQRSELPELHQEEAVLVFQDAGEKNWFMVFKNFQQMGE
jgi:hypothetical protein